MAAALRIRIATSERDGKGKQEVKRNTGIPGEHTEGVMTAAELADKTARDPRFRLKGETLVIGGDNAAFESALCAVRQGSEKVTIVCPEKADEMRADEDLIEQARQNGIRVIHGWAPSRIEAHTDGLVSGVFLKHCDRAFDDEGRFSPVYDEGNVRGQYCDNLILAVQ